MKAKEIINDDINRAVSSNDDAERSDKAVIDGSTRQWRNLPSKMHVCSSFPGLVFFICHYSNFCLNKTHVVV